MGARAPDGGEVRWGGLEANVSGWRVACDRSFSPPLSPKHVIAEVELARLTEDADRALAKDGSTMRAEDTPPCWSGRRGTPIGTADWPKSIAWRAATEAALATLLDAMPLREAGLLGAELLADAGRADDAADALEQAAEREAMVRSRRWPSCAPPNSRRMRSRGCDGSTMPLPVRRRWLHHAGHD